MSNCFLSRPFLRHAFAADSLLSLVYQIVRGNFPPIPTDQFSAGLSDLVNRLLARDANTRPSLGEVGHTVRACSSRCLLASWVQGTRRKVFESELKGLLSPDFD